MRLRRRMQLLLLPFIVLLAANLGLDRYFVHQRDQVLAVVDGRLKPSRLALADLLAALVDQETGERGYIITGQEAFLEPYNAGEVQADARLAELERLLDFDPNLSAGVQRLRSRMAAWRQLGAGFELDAKRQGRDAEAAALVATRTGMALFDGARAELTALQSSVRAELERRDARLEDLRRRLSEVRLASFAIGLAIVVACRWLLTRWITRPVEALGRAVRLVAGGALDRQIRVSGPPDVAELSRDVEAMRERLLVEVDRASTAQSALAQRGMVVLGMRDELAPGPLEVHDGLHVAARFRPAEGVVAGDWFDVVPLSGDRVAIALIDVSGHGAGAGVFALKTKYLTLAALHDGLGPAASLQWVAAKLGDTGENFLTGVVLEIDLASRSIRYANAGHPPVLVAGGKELAELGPTGPLLGPLPATWAEGSCALEAGATLVLYSDGLIEARGVDGQEFGADRLRAMVDSHRRRCDPDALAATCLHELDRFAAGTKHDDITLVVAGPCSGPQDSVGGSDDLARNGDAQPFGNGQVHGQAKAAGVLHRDL